MNGQEIITSHGAELAAQAVLQEIRQSHNGDRLSVLLQQSGEMGRLVDLGWIEADQARADCLVAAADICSEHGEECVALIIAGAIPISDAYEAPAPAIVGRWFVELLESWERIISDAPAENRTKILRNAAIDVLGATDRPDGPAHPDAIDWLHGFARANGLSEYEAGEAIRLAVERREAPTPETATETTAETPADPWNDPDYSLLEDRRGALPDFPLATLPVRWREWAALAAHGAGVTPGHVVVPLLAVASSLIGAARRVQASRSWSEPFTCWAAVVGYSGSGKTPGIDVIARHLAQIERDRKGDVAELQRAHDTRAETARASLKAWKKEVEAATAEAREIPPRPPEACEVSEFVTPRLFVRDATVERLAVLLQARPRGVLVIADELAGLFLNMGRYSNGSDREFWLEAWNGKPFSVERMGRPPVNLDRLLIGITGGLQPDKLVRSFEGDADGMYARVCFAWPAEPSYRPLTNEIAEIEPDVINALGRLIDIQDSEGDASFSRAVPLDSRALTDFEQFRQFLHTAKAGLDGREREWWAKGASHVLRLAGTLAFLAWSIEGGSEPATIGAAHMAAAVDLWRGYFWPHSQAALRQIGISERHANARKVLRWTQANGRREIGVKDARREALAQSLDAKQTEALLDSLTGSGWLKRKPAEKTGGRPVVRWLVNEALFSAESAASAETRPVGLSALSASGAGALQ
jgi:hypothetical protein